MKKQFTSITLTAGCFVALLLSIASCSDKPEEVLPSNSNKTIPAEVIETFRQLGFDTETIRLEGESYLLEGDILVTPEELVGMSDNHHDTGGSKEEQYRVYNAVSCNGGRTITIFGNLTGTLSSGLDWAIANYNAVNTCFTFQRIYRGTADITITEIPGVWAYSGYPTSGNPYPGIYIGSGAASYGTNYVECLFTHNIGHCMGMAHTDPFAGAGGCPNDVGSTPGVVHIPGTPTGSDSNSIFNTCACANKATTGELSTYDKAGFTYLY
ncbi:M57 family metalloprotease [Roseivirga sp. BDSF3-8]|uniref:M57 family metalloprotease n=1 Tax=Roseivirga sp. BDSF3-8 TaxID=3241598 RepID=UPI003531C7B4